ncbi:hypothetical protein ACGF5C_24805 [Micromonospora sp. NPDC047620]|uniref:hypothetical protein n=1 Tax=Micromonospora sp. NPDC047620 TaxID=3364251 RepID=UPI003723C119
MALVPSASKVPRYLAGEPGSPNQMVSSRSATSYTYSRISPVLPKKCDFRVPLSGSYPMYSTPEVVWSPWTR